MLNRSLYLLDGKEPGTAERIRELTAGRGADVCLEVSGSYRALHEAIRSVAYSARSSQRASSRGKPLDYHWAKSSTTIASRSSAHRSLASPQPSPIGGTRTGCNRHSMDLVTSRQVHVEPLVSRVLPVEKSAQAFELVDNTPQDVIQVVLSLRRRRNNRPWGHSGQLNEHSLVG